MCRVYAMVMIYMEKHRMCNCKGVRKCLRTANSAITTINSFSTADTYDILVFLNGQMTSIPVMIHCIVFFLCRFYLIITTLFIWYCEDFSRKYV